MILLLLTAAVEVCSEEGDLPALVCSVPPPSDKDQEPPPLPLLVPWPRVPLRPVLCI